MVALRFSGSYYCYRQQLLTYQHIFADPVDLHSRVTKEVSLLQTCTHLLIRQHDPHSCPPSVLYGTREIKCNLRSQRRKQFRELLQSYLYEAEWRWLRISQVKDATLLQPFLYDVRTAFSDLNQQLVNARNKTQPSSPTTKTASKLRVGFNMERHRKLQQSLPAVQYTLYRAHTRFSGRCRKKRGGMQDMVALLGTGSERSAEAVPW